MSSLFTSGSMASVGNGSVYLKRDPKGTNVVYVLNPTLDSILSAPKFGVFKPKAPFNASWVSIGKEDVGNELGEKPSAKAFIWVLQPKNPKDLKEGFETKLWECTKTEYETISTQVNEYGHELKGMMVVMSKPAARWNIVANKPPASKTVPAAVLDAAWDELKVKGTAAPTEAGFDEDAFGTLVNVIKSKELQRKFLIERSQGACKTWNEVRRAFGLSPIADGDAVEEDNEVEAY